MNPGIVIADWADIVFGRAAFGLENAFTGTQAVLYWGVVVAAIGQLLWWVVRPFLRLLRRLGAWIRKRIVTPIYRFLKRLVAFLGKVAVVLGAAYLAAVGLWEGLRELDWINGGTMLGSFGALTAITALHFLRGGQNELFDAAVDAVDTADMLNQLSRS
jgi:hypothetical protein